MKLGEMLGIKQEKLVLKGDYPTIQDLFEKIKDAKFEAGEPSLYKEGFTWIIIFPRVDRNNQVQILGSKNNYTVLRNAQPAGNLLSNMALDNLTGGLSSMSAAFGNSKKRCMALVDSTIKTINELGL